MIEFSHTSLATDSDPQAKRKDLHRQALRQVVESGRGEAATAMRYQKALQGGNGREELLEVFGERHMENLFVQMQRCEYCDKDFPNLMKQKFCPECVTRGA